MDSNTTISIGLVIALIGSLATMYNFITSKSVRSKMEGQWQGRVDEKLDTIIKNFATLTSELQKANNKIDQLESEVNAIKIKIARIEKTGSVRGIAEG